MTNSDAILQICRLFAANFPAFSKNRDNEEKSALMGMWTIALAGYSPETILRAGAKLCCELRFPPVLADVMDACEAIDSEDDDDWADAWADVVEHRGPIGAARKDEFRDWLKSAAHPRVEAVAKSFLSELFPIDGYPNMGIIRAQFREAYEAAQRRDRRKRIANIVHSKTVLSIGKERYGQPQQSLLGRQLDQRPATEIHAE